MSLRCLRVFAILFLAFPVCSHAQSLGDVARQLRAERRAKPTPHARVITNDDIATKPAPAVKNVPRDESKNETAASAPAAGSAGGSIRNAEVGADSAKGSGNPGKTPVNERDAEEFERQKRTQEINQRYLDSIAALRAQINATQKALAKLQKDQIESTLEFQRTLGVSPTPGSYEQQQRLFAEQIQEQRNLVSSLSSQLEDAEEAARHAGVPHASD